MAGTTNRNALAELIAQKVREAIAQAIKDAQPELEQIAKDGGDAAAIGIVGQVGSLSSLLSDVALAALITDPPVGLGLEAIKQAEKQGGSLSIASALGYMLGYQAFTMLNPLFMPVQHAIAHTLQNEIHTPQDAAALVARRLMEPGHGSQEAKGSALDQDHFDRLVSLATVRPDVGMALEMLRRGELTDSFVHGELEHLGYTSETVDALMKLRKVLLTPADLALAQLRGHLSRDDMLKYASTLGVGETDMDTLVANTGEPPGPEQLLEAYRRGFIDEQRLVRGIRQSRIRNEWIDVVERLRFEPMSVADAVRAVVEHHLTDSQGKSIAQQNGLEPEHWHTLVESWGRPLAHMEMGSAVHRGIASRAQFDQAMRESDVKNKYIPLSYELTERLLPERLIVSAIHYNAISLKTGAKRLLALGYSREDAGILLKLGLHEQHASAHELTRSQIATLYADGILHHDQAVTHLRSLGYSEQDAKYTLQIVDIQQHIRQVKQEVAAIRISFLAGGLNAEQAESRLHALGETPEQARHLIDIWDTERHRAARTLSEAQIVKAAEAGVMRVDEAITLLESIGYSPSSASILLREKGVAIPR